MDQPDLLLPNATEAGSGPDPLRRHRLAITILSATGAWALLAGLGWLGWQVLRLRA